MNRPDRFCGFTSLHLTAPLVLASIFGLSIVDAQAPGFRECFNRALHEQRNLDIDTLLEAKLRYHHPQTAKIRDGHSTSEFEDLIRAGRADSNQSIQTYAYEPATYRGLKCTAKINGQTEQLTYLGGGRGRLFPFFSDEKKANTLSGDLLQIWQSKVSAGFGPGGDFGVWKLERKGTPCIQLSRTNTRPGEYLQTLSQTCRDGYSINRRGQMAFFSAGQDQTSKLAQYRPNLSIAPYRHTTIESDNCSSGSTVIGEDGSVKGALTQDSILSPVYAAFGPP